MTSLLQKIILGTFDLRGVIPAVKMAAIILVPYAFYLTIVAIIQYDNAASCSVFNYPVIPWWSCP